MATVTGLAKDTWQDPVWPVRVRTFIWLSTGMFSVAALTLAFLGYLWTGSLAAVASHFFASIASAVFFVLACSLKFGPDEM